MIYNSQKKRIFWGKEKDYIAEALNSTWISGGYFVDTFEKLISDRFEFPYVVSTTNGTSALQAVFLSMGLKPGDEIIIPGYGFQAAANLAIQMNLTPKFADIDEDSKIYNSYSIKEQELF